jgi:hypothetical protein
VERAWRAIRRHTDHASLVPGAGYNERLRFACRHLVTRLRNLAQILLLKRATKSAMILNMGTLHRKSRQSAARAGKRPAKRRPKKAAADVLMPNADVPYWVPAGSLWRAISPGTRRAVEDLVAPAYRRFVVEAQDELERSLGLTLVHLLWLEICDQVAIGPAVADRLSAAALVEDPAQGVERHLRLVATKCQISELMFKMRAVEAALRATTPAPLPPPLPLPALGVESDGDGVVR